MNIFRLLILMTGVFFSPLTIPWGAFAETTVDQVLDRVEARYSGPGFFAEFHQTSTVKAMEITDTATGNVLIKRPGMMKWEYFTPEKQSILTDGKTIWVYRPEDKQVMTGNAPEYFGNGKGASFLSDIRLIRKQFDVFLEKESDPRVDTLKMVPLEKKYDITEIILTIPKADPVIQKVVTRNPYGDETVILFRAYRFDENPPDETFRFQVPAGVDVLHMEN